MYPFKKLSFWIIIMVSLSMLLALPIVKGQVVSHDLNRGWGYVDWKPVFNVRPDESIYMKWLLFEMQLFFMANYLGHLISFKEEKKL